MSMEISLLGGFNPFEWEKLRCPVCNRNQYCSINHAAVYCSYCNAQFVVRTTAGDPGCVIDCHVHQIHAPLWKCKDCDARVALFEWQKLICPHDAGHTLQRCERVFASWDRPVDFPGYFYLILKHGDYCSSWIHLDHTYTELDHPSQDEWDEFQKGLNLNC